MVVKMQRWLSGRLELSLISSNSGTDGTYSKRLAEAEVQSKVSWHATVVILIPMLLHQRAITSHTVVLLLAVL